MAQTRTADEFFQDRLRPTGSDVPDSSKVVVLDSFRRSSGAEAGEGGDPFDIGSSSPQKSSIPTSKLYADTKAPDLNLALKRIGDALTALDEAVQGAEEDDPVAIDNAMIRFAGTLPDLFLCSTLGDGFAAAVVGINYALHNKAPDPFCLQEIYEFRFLMRKLRDEPFLDHDDAVRRLIKLEELGLIVDPIPSERIDASNA